MVCPLLRGSSPTRWVAPKTASGAPACFLSGIFRAGSLYPLAPGCRRSWRGEVWFRPARCCSTGSGRLGGAAAAAATLSGTGSASPRPDRNSWLRGAPGPALTLFLHHAREGADGQAVVCPLLRGRSPTRGVAPKQHRGAPACFHSGISGWFSLSLNPLARGCRRIWRGEIWKYGFGGAVADFVLVISGSRRRPRRSQVRGQLRHDPIATAG